MFGFFKGKTEAKAATKVHAEVGASLTKAPEFPVVLPPSVATDFGHCAKVAVEGRPPGARFVYQAIPGQTATAYRVSGVAGQPSLALVNRGGRSPNFEVWELSADGQPGFTKARPVNLDPAQASWVGYLLLDVACLPARQLLVAVSYNEPEARQALFVYDMAGNAFRKLARVAPDTSAGLPFKYFETLPAGRDAVLVRYGTDAQRLAAEVYVNRFDHVLLFSPRHPQGLEVLTLGIADGNIRRWELAGKTLWLATADERDAAKPVVMIWSLDLSKVLP